MKALVLSGGNIKGAYQAGAIAQVLESGWIPDVVTGISVGALNAAYLAAAQPLNPTNTGVRLEAFWRAHITSPKVAVKRRGYLELVYRAIFNRWDGVVSTAPLEALVRGALRPAPYVGLEVHVGASNLVTGELEYTESRDPAFLDAVLASTAEPVLMPARRVRGALCYDGGLRDIAPMSKAIELGATEVVAILCQPEHETLPPLAAGKVLDLIDHAMSIVTNEIITNDIATFESINDLIQANGGISPTYGHRYIPLTVIRPAQALGASVTAFTPADISRMIEQGRADAKAALALAASKA